MIKDTTIKVRAKKNHKKQFVMITESEEEKMCFLGPLSVVGDECIRMGHAPGHEKMIVCISTRAHKTTTADVIM